MLLTLSRTVGTQSLPRITLTCLEIAAIRENKNKYDAKGQELIALYIKYSLQMNHQNIEIKRNENSNFKTLPIC